MKYIVGNWKNNQSLTQSLIWLDDLATLRPKFSEFKKTILCLPFTEIAAFNQKLNELNLPIATASQNVSHLAPGKHTGEINAYMLSELVSYCLVGHSERRNDFGETSSMVAEKCQLLLENTITPIVCLDTPYLDEQIKELFQKDIEVSRCVFVFEPHSAIGTGIPLNPKDANHIAHQVSFLTDYKAPVLYGGSVSSDIVASYLEEPNISGVLVGADSLNPSHFAEIINVV